MVRRLAQLLLVAPALGAACARPAHEPAPTSPPRPPEIVNARTTPTALRVAIFEPSGGANWAGTLELSPQPAAVVAPCLEPGAIGWISVNLETHGTEASTTSIAEASPDTTPEARACVLNALRGVHAGTDAIRLLVYVTFSPEPREPREPPRRPASSEP